MNLDYLVGFGVIGICLYVWAMILTPVNYNYQVKIKGVTTQVEYCNINEGALGYRLDNITTVTADCKECQCIRKEL